MMPPIAMVYFNLVPSTFNIFFKQDSIYAQLKKASDFKPQALIFGGPTVDLFILMLAGPYYIRGNTFTNLALRDRCATTEPYSYITNSSMTINGRMCLHVRR